jgi:hypothetical protein
MRAAGKRACGTDSGSLLALLALLVHKNKYFTCFTGTQVQILTRMRALAALMRHSSGSLLALLALLVQKYKY